MNFRAQVIGCGAYLPERIVSNAELALRLDTSDEWIVQRTGIRERRIAAPGELTSDPALRAAERALATAVIKGAQLHLNLLATATPGNTVPASTAQSKGRPGPTL